MKSPNNEVDRIFPPSKNWILWCTCHFLRQSLGRSYGKPESEPHGDIAQTLEKLAKKRPYWASHSHTDKSTADSILWSNTFFWGGGWFLHLFSFFVLPPVIFSCLSSSCCWCCFFVHCFFLLLLFASSKEKEEKKRNGINMRKEESNKRKTKTKKRKSRKMKDNNKDTQQRMKNKGGMNKSILCQQRGYFLFCCPKLVLKNRV